MSLVLRKTTCDDFPYAETISMWYKLAAKEKGTGIAQRAPEYLKDKMKEGNAILGFYNDELVGFCYIETFENKSYVSNSGLIVKENHRGKGYAKKIKEEVMSLVRSKYPEATVFGLTTSEKVMKINSDLGYYPTCFDKLTSDQAFWKGCSSCTNYHILQEKNQKICLCTAMIAPPTTPKSIPNEK